MAWKMLNFHIDYKKAYEISDSWPPVFHLKLDEVRLVFRSSDHVLWWWWFCGGLFSEAAAKTKAAVALVLKVKGSPHSTQQFKVWVLPPFGTRNKPNLWNWLDQNTREKVHIVPKSYFPRFQFQLILKSQKLSNFWKKKKNRKCEFWKVKLWILGKIRHSKLAIFWYWSTAKTEILNFDKIWVIKVGTLSKIGPSKLAIFWI